MQNSAGHSVDLRPIAPSDAAAVAALHAGSFQRGWSVGEVQALLRSGSIGIIAFWAGEAAGFLLARTVSPEAEIISLAVSHDLRRRGLASGMLAAIEREFAARRCTKIFLEVAETNYGALKLYGCHDFKKVGKRPAYYREPDGHCTAALLLQKDYTL